MSTNIETLLKNVQAVSTNPSAVQRVVLNTLESVRNGEYTTVDPSNPFAFLLEASCVLAVAGMNRSEANMRKIYPSLAQTYEQLYHHMSDVDYLNRFAIPAKASFTLLLSFDEVKQRAMVTEDGISKIVIPKDTRISVEGYTFTLYYPIEIRIMPYGGVQVVYDVDTLNPLHTLETNIIEHGFTNMPGNDNEFGIIKLLYFSFDAYQYKINSYTDQLNLSTGYIKDFSFTDQYYAARVYISASDSSEWVEILTTHSDQVYDPTKTTAVLTVGENKLRVKIPIIYFTNEKIERGIRIDILTTKGEISLDLRRYAPNSYNVKWDDLSKNESKYNKAIRDFTTKSIFSESQIKDGSDGLDFNTLRERVINHSFGLIDVPITNTQIVSLVDTRGYKIVKDIDNITNRIFLASKELPIPEQDSLSTPIACTIHTLQTSTEELSKLNTVNTHHTNRVTIRSGTLFTLKDGILQLVSSDEVEYIKNSDIDTKLNLFDTKKYVYNPFHYVLDMTDDYFSVRPYFMDYADINSKHFIKENRTTRLQVATMRYAITTYEDGYKIAIITRSSDSFKLLEDRQVHAQLSFIPEGEIDRAHLNGVLEGRTDQNEFVFTFYLTTNYDIDADHLLQLTSFKMISDETYYAPTKLNTKFDLVYMVSDYSISGMVRGDIDELVGEFLLEDEVIAIIHEKIDTTFGSSLDGLWSRSRTVASNLDYVRYEDDVLATYKDRVYKRNETTGAIEFTIDEEGKLQYTILHEVGDPVLDEQGVQLYEHRAGDVKVDKDGLPITLGNRRSIRQIDLMLFEGEFKFIDDPTLKTYTSRTIRQLVSYIKEDINSFSLRLLENSDIWYYPESTIGDVNCLINDGVTTILQSEQSFTVRYYLSQTAYANPELKESLAKTAIKAIVNNLAKRTISISNMIKEIREYVGTDIIDVSISGLGGSEDYDVVTISEQGAKRLSLAKRLVRLPNAKLSAEDDVTIEFIKHTSN